VRSLDQLRNIEAGFRTERTLLVNFDPGRNGYKGQRERTFYQRLLGDVQKLPGRENLAGVRNLKIAVEPVRWE
jgi:hypothetical protein